MRGNFACALAHVLSSEGGYCNDPKDPGGATDDGVTQAEYDSWRTRHGEQPRDVRLIAEDEIAALYREDYWQRANCDALPLGVDYATFDFAVNSGVGEAARCLQRAAGATADGVIGPATIAAVATADPGDIVHSLCVARLAFLKTLRNWAHDEHGWRARVEAVEITAKGMIAC